MDARTLTLFQTTFQPILEKTTHQFVSDTQTLLDDAELNKYINQIEQLVIMGGKRARPYICALAYTTNGGTDLNTIKDMLVAIELFHVFGLIHDDIIDQGDKRHNQTTLHRFVANESLGHSGDNEHRGTAQAILMGDFVYSWANQLVTQMCQKVDATTAAHLSIQWHTMNQSVLAGQMLDTASATRKAFAHELIMRTIELKTAAYSVTGPMKLGGMLAQASPNFMDLAETYGKAFGIAYQLQDDLLDLLHTEVTTDKTAGRDAGQHTYITDFIAQHGTPSQQQRLYDIQNSSSPSCELLRELVLESKTDVAIRDQIAVYFNDANIALANSNLTPPQQAPWRGLIELIKNRDR